MNHWQETAEIVARLAALGATGRQAALATVVRIAGSAYRRPGAKLLIERDGDTLGGVSGGCLEADVREVAQAVLESGRPCLRHYHTGTDEDIIWGLGLGCNGLVDVFVQPATMASPLAPLIGRLGELCAGDEPFALATVIEGGEEELGATLAVEESGAVRGALGTLGDGGLVRQVTERSRAALPSGRAAVLDVDGRRLFVEALAPPPHLLVCGAGDDARPLVAYAADAGFRVTVTDHRPALLSEERFPQAARRVLARPEEVPGPALALPAAARARAVVMTHSLALDRGWLARLLAAGVPYVGVLGPRARTESLLREIGAPEEGRVFGPVGLDLGADGPRQVALAIVAELLAWQSGRTPGHLCERQEAIHAG